MDCDDNGIDRESVALTSAPPDLIAADPSLSALIKRPTEKHPLTSRHDVNVHTAITAGLASYLLTLDGAYAGKSTRLESVIYDWADRNDGARPTPSAAVHTEESGKYETSSGMAPGPPVQVDGEGPTQLTNGAIYALDELMVEIYCTDKVQRAGVRRMLEDACWPVQWMAGFRLVLPQYHSAIATFLALSGQYADNTENAMADLRPLVFRFRARCPTYQVHRLPLAKPKTIGDVTI